MCCRFVLKSHPDELEKYFGFETEMDYPERYNIAPTDPVLGLADTGRGRHWRVFRWGLIPSWAKDLSMGARMVNARSESVFDKPAYRAAVRRRRCLVPADGFYEWAGKKGSRQPYYISMADSSLFAIAAIWEHWESGEGDIIESCSLMTTGANSMISGIHHRMPVILDPGQWNLWLDSTCEDRKTLDPLLRPYPDGRMQLHPVGNEVGNPRNEGEQLIAPFAGDG